MNARTGPAPDSVFGAGSVGEVSGQVSGRVFASCSQIGLYGPASGGMTPRTARTSAQGDRSCAACGAARHRSSPEKICRKNRNTFSVSRKIDAASNGAVVMSCECRIRWKSNMVKPAKMTRPSTE